METKCKKCWGYGVEVDNNDNICEECNGTGKVGVEDLNEENEMIKATEPIKKYE